MSRAALLSIIKNKKKRSPTQHLAFLLVVACRLALFLFASMPWWCSCVRCVSLRSGKVPFGPLVESLSKRLVDARPFTGKARAKRVALSDPSQVMASNYLLQKQAQLKDLVAFLQVFYFPILSLSL